MTQILFSSLARHGQKSMVRASQGVSPMNVSIGPSGLFSLTPNSGFGILKLRPLRAEPFDRDHSSELVEELSGTVFPCYCTPCPRSLRRGLHAAQALALRAGYSPSKSP
jgi:hypothetical protein